MYARCVRLIDDSSAVVATAAVTDAGPNFEGTIVLDSTPPQWRARFEEFVNGQMLSFLDEIEGKIGSRPLEADFDDGSEVRNPGGIDDPTRRA